MLHNPGDFKGRWPKRWFCRHKNSVTRRFYWLCPDCKALKFDQAAIDAWNAYSAALLEGK